MFEFNQYDARLHSTEPAEPEQVYRPADRIAKMSLMYWWEHCTECAAPSCYTTCDLYEARPDTRCRRFRYGIYRNRRFASVRRYGAEVAFKKWGVIGAVGNTAMESKSSLLWKERLLACAVRISDAFAPLFARLTRDARWQYLTDTAMRRLCNRLHRRGKGGAQPDAFVLEIFNPGNRPVRMQVAMEFAPESLPSLVQIERDRTRFRTTVTLPPGYSRHDFERRLFQSVTDTGLPFQLALIPEADTAPTLVFLAADFVTFRGKTAASAQPDIKCVVWDLDNTLWDGVLIEGDDVKLKPEVKEILAALDRRGILLSVASKNDHDSAWQRLEAFGIAEYFLCPQIGWMPKSESVRQIARRLNIGIDTLAFIDDSPHERSEVGSAVPEVLCLDAADMSTLLAGKRLQGSGTADAQNRRRYYQEALVREQKQAEFGDDYLRFLKHCDIHLEISGYRTEDFDRVAELVQRTNQLNFSGRKYDRGQLAGLLEDSSIEKYALSCSDRFGSYGLIGFGLVTQAPDEISVQDLMLSCRVQGKRIEDAFFSHLEAHHNARNAARLRVCFQTTRRNLPARQALDAAGFESAAGSGYVRSISHKNAADSAFIRVDCSVLSGATAESQTEGQCSNSLSVR